MDKKLCIAGKEISAGSDCYIIAEAGVNHNGCLATAFTMVEAAAACGADAVKFQAFSADRLVTGSAKGASYQHSETQHGMLKGLELHRDDFIALTAHCAGAGVQMLVTPFSPEDVEMMVELGAEAIKVASPDIVNIPLLEVIAKTKLPVILSTGAAEIDEIARAIDTLDSNGCEQLALTHCVSSYPTPLAQANLKCIGTLSDKFGLPVGYSDHTADIVTGALAVSVGAAILEKHFTLDPDMHGPDHNFSLRPVELAAYIVRARRTTPGELDTSQYEEYELAALGDGVKTAADHEQDVRNVARSSVTAMCDISAGQTISRDMLTIKRPGGGLAPAMIDIVVGRSPVVDIPADTTITADMLGDKKLQDS